MFIEVDVQAGDNCDYPVNRMFSAVGKPKPVIWLCGPGPRGEMGTFQVTGWSAEGPCPAYAVQVEDSGEGMALLVYGGDEGIRLKSKASLESWSLSNSDQWGEPCLLLDMDSEVEYAEKKG